MAIFVKRKSDVLKVFAGFLADIKGQGCTVPRGVPSLERRHRAHEGGVRGDAHQRGIRCEYTRVDSPKHDGAVERRIAP